MANEPARASECDGSSWKIAITSDDRGRMQPMRMHLGGSNVSILSFADGSHVPTHDLHLPSILLIWRGSQNVCCDLRDVSNFIEYIEEFEVLTTLHLQLVDLSHGVFPLTAPLVISQGSIDVAHTFNEILYNGPNMPQQHISSPETTSNESVCSWSTFITISIIAPQSHAAEGLSTAAVIKSGDIIRVLITVNELENNGFKVFLYGMKFTPFWIFIHNDALVSPPLSVTFNAPLFPIPTLDDVLAQSAVSDNNENEKRSSVFWIDLLHSFLSSRGCPPSSLSLRRAPSGQRICSSKNGSTVFSPNDVAFITTTSRAHWHTAMDGAYGGHVHVFSCLSRFTTTGAMDTMSGSHVHLHPWCLSSPPPSPSQSFQSPLFRPLQSFHDVYKSVTAPLPASCETGQLVQRLRGSVSVQAAAAMLCRSNQTEISSLNLLHIDAGMEGWCILSDVVSAVNSGRGPVVDQIAAVLPMPCASSSPPASSFGKRCFSGACNITAWQLNHIKHPLQWLDRARAWTHEGGEGHSVLLAASILQAVLSSYVIIVVDELHEDLMKITLMRKQSWESPSFHTSSSTSRVPVSLLEESVALPLPPCAHGPVCVCGFPNCSTSTSASSCLPPPLLRFVTSITRICALPRMRGKCKGLVHEPLSCSAAGSNFSGADDDDYKQQNHQLRCTGESYDPIPGRGKAVMILEQNDALKRLVMYGLWHGNVSTSIAASSLRDTAQNFTSSSSTSTPLPCDQLSSSSHALTDDSNIVISSIRKGSGGLGNVIYSMIVGLTVAAYSKNSRFYATMYSDGAWKRYGGLFSAAIEDNVFNHVEQGYRHHDDHCPRKRTYDVPTVLDGDYWAMSSFKYAISPGEPMSQNWIETQLTHCIVCSQWSKFHALAMVVQQPISPAVTLLSHSSGSIIRNELGDMLVTFMSHFLITPAPGLRMEIESFVKGMRMSSGAEPSPFIIGIHMRWAHESQIRFQEPFHAQYAARVGLSSKDFDAFVDAAYALAEGHPRVVFYIASDSLTRLLDLKEALSQPERAWSVVTADVLTNVSDGTTTDSIIDLFVLSMCDDLIASHTSTFSHIAAALGGHRPVLISAELSFKFGRHSLRRPRTLDWTMPTDAWASFTPDLPFESWISGGMSYGARDLAVKCQNISDDEASAAVDAAASFFVELNRKQ